MTLARAHAFIRATGSDTALAGEVRALGDDPHIDAIGAIGASAGFDFDADALRAAFRQHWALQAVASQAGKGSGDGKRDSSSRASAI